MPSFPFVQPAGLVWEFRQWIIYWNTKKFLGLQGTCLCFGIIRAWAPFSALPLRSYMTTDIFAETFSASVISKERKRMILTALVRGLRMRQMKSGTERYLVLVKSPIDTSVRNPVQAGSKAPTASWKSEVQVGTQLHPRSQAMSWGLHLSALILILLCPHSFLLQMSSHDQMFSYEADCRGKSRLCMRT